MTFALVIERLRMECGRALRPLSSRAVLWVLGSASGAALFLISVAPLPFSIRSIKQTSGGQVLDTAFAYSVEEGLAALHRLGPTGRNAYLTYLAFDVVFACCYGTFLAGTTFKSMQGSHLATALASIPLATATCDISEDIGMALSLSTYPDTPRVAMAAASATGAAKHIGFYASVAIVIGSLIYSGRHENKRWERDESR